MNIAILTAALVADVQFEDLATLDRRLAAFGATQPVDARLKLPKCDTTAEITDSGPRAIAVRCPSAGWRLFVPRMLDRHHPQGPPAIRRGDVVELTVTGRGFSIVTPAMALEDGHIGQRLRLKAETKAAVISATLGADGTARLETNSQP